jgi:6-phosphogluconolactonase
MSEARFHIGTYEKGGGKGLYAVRVDGDQLHVESVFGRARNASFGTYSERHELLYLVDEDSAGSVGAFRYLPAGWQVIDRVPSGGAAPCYLSLDPSEETIAVANYDSGSVSIIALDPDSGRFAGHPKVRVHQGNGPNQERQAAPHAHCVLFSGDGDRLFAVDLGADRIFSAELHDGMPGPYSPAFVAPPGSGPRHLLLHPDRRRAYLMSELASELTVLKLEDGGFSRCTSRSSLPAGFEGSSLGGHIALNRAGDRLYASNRGHDSIAVFAIEGEDLRPLQHIAARGVSPRHFLLAEEEAALVCASEKSGTVSLFSIDGDGTLTAAGAPLDIAGAAFVAALPGDHAGG